MSDGDRNSQVDADTAGNVNRKKTNLDSNSNHGEVKHKDEDKQHILDKEKVQISSVQAISDKNVMDDKKQIAIANQRRESKSIHSSVGRMSSAKRHSGYVDPNQIIQKGKINLKKELKNFVLSKHFDYAVMVMVLFYTVIIFAYFALDTNEYDGQEEITTSLRIIQFIELSILIIFCIEILLRVYALTSKVYYKDNFYRADTVFIVLSLLLTILDILITDIYFTIVSRVIRSIFRFARLFLVIKKINEIQQIKALHLEDAIKTPVERIMDIFAVIEENIEDANMAKKLKWCIEMVSSNKLYEPILADGEATLWGNNYANAAIVKTESKKKTVNNKQPASAGNTGSIQDPPTPQAFAFKPILVPMEQMEFFKKLDEISFDVFKYHETFKENNLANIMIHLFNKYDIFFKAKIEPQHLFNWANLVAKGYQDNFYHNKMHAFDVTQVSLVFIPNKQIKTLDFNGVADLSALEMGIMYMSAAAHDYQHPGFNNPYLINSRNELAIRYNDKSPLENHHAFSTFYLMQQENCNVFVHFSKIDFKKSRERVVNMILHTDNSQHFADLAKLKGRLSASDFDPKDKDKDICMMTLLHAADVSNPYKPWEICKTWTFKVLDEFWNQGDKERESGLAISYLCDRYTTNTSKCQAGFIDFIVKPLYETVQKFLPLMDLTPFETNKAKWAELVEFYEEELAKLKRENELIELQKA